MTAADDEDRLLLGAIGRMFDELDPMPAGLTDRVRFVLALDSLEAEMASVTSEMALESSVRSVDSEDVRTLSLAVDEITAVLTVSRSPDGLVRLDGLIVPAMEATVRVIQGRNVMHARSNDLGRFSLSDLDPGQSWFLVLPDGATGLPAASRSILL